MNISTANLKKIREVSELNVALASNLTADEVKKQAGAFVVDLVALKRRHSKSTFEILLLEVR